jgi:hypothetical protein
MIEWFKAGGFGMIAILLLGAGSVAFGLKTVSEPTARRLAALKSLPSLIGLMALTTFGTNLWAVNVHLSDAAFLKARNFAPADLPFTALIGFTEAAQGLTLGGFLAMLVVALRMVAEGKASKAA